MAAFDAIVVGLGAMGSSACYHLARRGRRVLGIDRVGLGHDRGSSHGCSRIIRMCYYEHPDYVPLLRRAYELWDDLLQSSGVPAEGLFRRTGGVYMGPAGCEAVEGARRAAERHGLDHEMLSRSALSGRYPQFRVGEEFVGLYEPHAGYLVPEAALRVLQDGARSAGAKLLAETAIGWKRESSGIRVTCSDGRIDYAADRLIVTTGAWASELLGSAGVKVTATRQVLGWVRPRAPEWFVPDRCPVWAIDASHMGEGLYYGFPLIEGPDQRPGLKLARHAPGESVDPDQVDRRYRAGDEDTFRPCLARWMPQADGPVLSTAVCLYENSPDQHFIIDRHPMAPEVLLACGFSGHGFKFATVVGEILADLVMDGVTRHPIGFLRLSRFLDAGPRRA